MSYKSKNCLEKLCLHGFLIGMGMVFVFPFLWMIFTSMKVPLEMASARFQPFPNVPHPAEATPFFAVDEDLQLRGVPDGVEKALWRMVSPQIGELIGRRLEQWQPKLLSGGAVAIPDSLKEEFRRTMTEGCLTLVSRKISDQTRGVARQEHQRIRGVAAAMLDEQLDPAALEAGRRSMLAEAEILVNDDLLTECFDRVFKRLCFGEVKLRANNQIQLIPGSRLWQSGDGKAELTAFETRNSAFNLTGVDYRRNDRAEIFRRVAQREVPDIDRIYIGYRADGSWARLYFEVDKDGKRFRTREVVNCVDNNWAEAELRWTDDRVDMTTRKGFYILEETGEKADPEHFEIRVVMEKSNPIMAWYDKILRNYRIVFREVPFARYFMTSLALCILNIVLNIFSCTLTAYAFSRLKWPGRSLFFAIMLGTMMLPGQVLMIPGFLVNRSLGFYNTLIPLWLFSAFGSAFFIFLLRQYMLTIPKSLEDSARIDGCGFLGVYWHVVMPLVKPTIATIAIFTFTGTWNNFMGALIYVNDERLFPLALGLFKFNLSSGTDVGLMMAGSFLMILPIMILFFFAQNYFIQGIALTGTKE